MSNKMKSINPENFVNLQDMLKQATNLTNEIVSKHRRKEFRKKLITTNFKGAVKSNE